MQRIKKLYQQLLTIEKPVRITNSLIGKRLGITANLQRNLAKLPNTKALLDVITETNCSVIPNSTLL